MLDIGAGDARFTVALARSDPRSLAVALDADPTRLAEASRRAARPARKGGVPNAVFVAAAAESIPPELDGRFDLVTVHMPWGSLMRAVVCAEASWTDRLATLLRPAGRVELLLSVTERDGGPPPLDAAGVARLAAAYGAAGFRTLEARPASAEEASERSTWARRTRAGTSERPAWWLALGAPTAGG